MSQVKVLGYTVSLDGFGTGEPQTLEFPFGETGHELQQWMFQRMMRKNDPDGKATKVEDLLEQSPANIGAYIMGRNMFSPNRGVEDESWKGWWGANPPYHCPVYVMTHYPREEIVMEGGTIFRFAQGSPSEVLALARDAAGEKDIQVGGGATTLRNFFNEGLIDDAILTIAPVIVGKGERFWDGIDDLMDRYERVDVSASGDAMQIHLVKRSS